MVSGVDLVNNPDLVTSSITSASINFGSTMYLVLYIFFGVLILGSVIFFIWWFNSFKHTIKIKEKLGAGRYLTLHDKAKIKKTVEGEFWKLRSRKALIGAPPAEALEITGRGLYYAECIHDVKSGLDAGYDWITQAKIGKIRVQQTQEERALLTDRLRRARDRKSKSVLDIIMQMSGLIFCAVIVISLLAFSGEVFQSLEDANREQAAAYSRIAEITEKQIVFQDGLNDLYSQLSCTAPSGGVTIPLDQSVRE